MNERRLAIRSLLQRIAHLVRAFVTVAVYDRSTISLLAANLLAIAIALLYSMSLRDLMFVYWLQTAMIGVSQVVRILCLKEFTNSGFTDRNGRPVNVSGGKISSAILFAIAYGFCHLILLVFIANDVSGGKIPPLEELLVCGLTFAGHQAYSTAQRIKLDRRGRPRMDIMMGAPFTRIWPMHAVFLVGGMGFASAPAWWLFTSLKAVADVVMHVREERSLQEALVEKRMMDEALARLAAPLQEAVAWYRECAEKGDAVAQLNLGKMYLEGRGVPQSNSEALAWLSKAADQSNPEAGALIAAGTRAGRW